MSNPTIIQACLDPDIFGRLFPTPETYKNWFTLLRAAYGLPFENEGELEVYRRFTGRTDTGPTEKAESLWLIIGRKGGKSKIVATITAYEILFSDHWKIGRGIGERVIFPIVAVDMVQGRIIFEYLKAIFSQPALKLKIERETQGELDLIVDGLPCTIRIFPANFRQIRGPLMGSFAADELAFWRSSEVYASPDTEIFTAVEPGLIPGSLSLAISSAYSQSGLLYQSYRQYFGKSGPDLCWLSGTRDMNPTFSERKIERALVKDRRANEAEYLSIFRDDVTGLYLAAAVDAAIVQGRQELLPAPGIQYHGFVDMSGGKKDSHSLAIAFQDSHSGKVIVAKTREIVPGANVLPSSVVSDFAGILRKYGLQKVFGDRYGAAWVQEAFQKEGITLEPSELNSSELYIEMVGPLSDNKIELSDDERLARQLKALQRKVVPGGKDKVLSGKLDQSHSDLSNAIAGVIVTALLAGKHQGGIAVSQAYLYGGDNRDSRMVEVLAGKYGTFKFPRR